MRNIIDHVSQVSQQHRRRWPSQSQLGWRTTEMAVRPGDQPALGWTVVLRRQPVRVVEGQAEGGYTEVFELICCDCGDHPDLDYRDVSPGLQRIRGPYQLAAGVAAYDKHLKLNHEQAPESQMPAYAGESLGVTGQGLSWRPRRVGG